MNSAWVKPSLVTAAHQVQTPVSACGKAVVARPRSVVFPGFSSFLHHKSTNANIRAFENAFISFMSFLCNLSKTNSVYTFLSPKRSLPVQEKDDDTKTMRVKSANQLCLCIYSLR